MHELPFSLVSRKLTLGTLLVLGLSPDALAGSPTIDDVSSRIEEASETTPVDDPAIDDDEGPVVAQCPVGYRDETANVWPATSIDPVLGAAAITGEGFAPIRDAAIAMAFQDMVGKLETAISLCEDHAEMLSLLDQAVAGVGLLGLFMIDDSGLPLVAVQCRPGAFAAGSAGSLNRDTAAFADARCRGRRPVGAGPALQFVSPFAATSATTECS